jgi:DNA-binding transcriptional ArsR family regulator
MREFLSIAKALSDESRARVLMFLGGGELCLCQIIEMLGLAPSTVSKHMTVLHHAGLVDARREGRWTYYRLPGRGAPAYVRQAVRWVRGALQGDQRVLEDARRLEVVRKTSKEKLCAHYRR